MGRSFIKQKDEKTILLVDGLNLAFRWKHSGAKQFANDYMEVVKSLARSYSCGKIIIVADKGSSVYRKNLDPEYKANRKALRENQTEQEKQDFADFIQEFNNTLLQLEELEGYPVLQYQGIEADDIAGYIVKNKKQLDIENIWLISTDRDWDLLLSDTVSRFSYINRKEFTLANWSTHYEYPHDKFLSIKCLIGDKGDNVPGIPQIGPKRAEALVEQYGDIFDIYDSLPINSHYKYIQHLNANAEQLLKNVELMSLLDYTEDIIGENSEDINYKIEEYMNE